MARPIDRARQRAEAMEAFTATVGELAAALGIEPVELPIRHKDPTHLQTVQLDAMDGFLRAVIERVKATEAEPNTAPDAPETSVSDETAQSDAAPAKPKKAR